jgi:hypothetical protein
MRMQAPQPPRCLQQQATPAAGGSGRLLLTGSSRTSNAGSHEGLRSGVSLESLTPLSCSLFSLLGVDKAALVQATKRVAGFMCWIKLDNLAEVINLQVN